jgi:hypothetical protein
MRPTGLAIRGNWKGNQEAELTSFYECDFGPFWAETGDGPLLPRQAALSCNWAEEALQCVFSFFFVAIPKLQPIIQSTNYNILPVLNNHNVLPPFEVIKRF